MNSYTAIVSTDRFVIYSITDDCYVTLPIRNEISSLCLGEDGSFTRFRIAEVIRIVNYMEDNMGLRGLVVFQVHERDGGTSYRRFKSHH